MGRVAKLKPVVGAVVTLNHDFHTRGNRVYRAGVRFRVVGVDFKYYLRVVVRGRAHNITVDKKLAERTFTVVSVPKQTEE